MTHVLLLITAYLFIGSIVMLIVNELVDGAITENEFVRGMFFWPGIVVFFGLHILLTYVRRILPRG